MSISIGDMVCLTSTDIVGIVTGLATNSTESIATVELPEQELKMKVNVQNLEVLDIPIHFKPYLICQNGVRIR